MGIPVQGHCDTRFAEIHELFEQSFEGDEEIGAAICFVLDGETVVDLWGGHYDAERTRAWERAVLRPLRPTLDGDDLWPACRQGPERSRKPSKPLREMVEAAGIEPAVKAPRGRENQGVPRPDQGADGARARVRRMRTSHRSRRGSRRITEA